MADKFVRSRNHKWRINTSYHNILGQGAYGIVYKTSNEEDEIFAVKRIDGERHPRVLRQNLDKLLQLDHENIVKIIDICQEDKVLFLFMTYCPIGDLNKYFRSKELQLREKIDIMEQVSNGIVYLHSKDVVHRDIKPDNILVFGDSKVTAKLSDFDLSKVLDPDVETSVMTSNVGTFGFKAPEFFQRKKDKQIYYHRNVDVFAAGLTFLAMIQYGKDSRNLIPHIETPKDESEVNQPIGSLIAERIKYQVPELNVVLIEDTENMETEVKRLVHGMTHYNPEERLSAVGVLQSLQKILSNVDSGPEHFQGEILHSPSGPKDQITETFFSSFEHVHKIVKPCSLVDVTQMDTGPENINEETLHPSFKMENFPKGASLVKKTEENTESLGFSTTEQCTWLKKVFTLNLRDDVSTMRLRSTKELITRGKGHNKLEQARNKKYIRVIERMTGREIREIISCTHEHCRVDVPPWDTDYIIEACTECNVIRTYNVNYPFLRHAFRGAHTDVMCCTPDGSLFLLDKTGHLRTFTWDRRKERFDAKNQIVTCLQNASEICYLKKYNFLVSVSCNVNSIVAVNLGNNSRAWQFEGHVGERKVSPNAISCDNEGQLFVGDDTNLKFMLLDGGTGELLRVFRHDGGIISVWEVCWIDASQQLTVLDGFSGRIHGFNISNSILDQ